MRLTQFLRAALFALTGLFSTALPAQDTRLSNVSVRTSAGGTDTLITGFTIGPGPNKTILVRAVGPTLGAFGVAGTLSDPKLELYNSSSVKIAENDNWAATDSAAFSAVGAFALAANSKDASLVTTLAPGSYTAQVSGVGGASGVALVEVYEVTGGATRLINLSTRAQVGTGANLLIPGITIAPGAGTRRLLLRAVGPTLGAFGVAGTLADPKLELYSGSTKIAENDNWGSPAISTAADAATLTAAFAANGAFALTPGSKDAALLINLDPGSYTLQVSGVAATTGTALVEVYDLTPPNQTGAQPNSALYVASLRPDPAATGSTASGYATILINPDNTATVNVTFTNLSSAQTSAHLQLGASRDYVLNLPAGQVTGRIWTFTPSGAYTTNDLINALNSGNLAVGLDSARFPNGELRGNFVAATGSQAFTAPAAPPALPANALTRPTSTDAARFLTQATFGPTPADVTDVTNRGITAWLDTQMSLSATPASQLWGGIKADVAAFPNPDPAVVATAALYRTEISNLNAAWFKITCTAPDQLRQRVAFALSEIFVVGAMEKLIWNAEVKAKYYDLLVNGAFGNYRQLLENITLDPAMGVWLSHWGNPKADPARGTSPDENYAREIMQLFSIGLVQLQPDGSLLLDSAGQPIPTYDQTTVSETAKVLTGWTGSGLNPATVDASIFNSYFPGWVSYGFKGDDHELLKPMGYFDRFHDKTAKRLVSLQQVPLGRATPTLVPANQTGPQDLKILLDALANHPNAGPFICRQLIQRLVTSNPSSAYLYRVAQVFANDGTGTRGNLGAVVRAILTDYEARSPDIPGNVGFGKIKEPLIRLTGFFRALNFRAPNGRFLDSYYGEFRGGFAFVGQANGSIAYIGSGFHLYQAPLNALTVFNFFSPDYSPPGPLAAAGLVAPELQIADTIAVIQAPNVILDFMLRDVGRFSQPPTGPSPFLVPDYSVFLPNAKNPTALVDQLNLLFCANQMTTATRSLIVSTLQTHPASATDIERVQTALEITVSSPDGAMQK